MVDFDSIRSAAASSGDTVVDDSETLPDTNFGTAPRVSCFPQTIMDAEAIVGLDFLGTLKDEQNLRGPNLGWREEGAVVLTLKNPEMVEGALWKDTETADDDERATKFKLVGMDSPMVGEAADKEDGEFVVTGVKYGSSEFSPATEVETFGESAREVMDDAEIEGHPMLEPSDTVVQFYFDGGRGQRVAAVLDRLGGTSSYYYQDGGEMSQTKGLLEYHPTHGTDAHEWGKDPYPRFTRTPDIRRDVYGEPIRIIRMFAEDPDESSGPTRQTINFLSIEETGQPFEAETFAEREYVPIESGEEDRYPQGEPLHNSILVWHDDDTAADDDSGVEEATQDIELDGGPLASALGSDEQPTDGMPSYEDLDEGWQEFIDEAASSGLDSEAFDESPELPDWKDAVEMTTREEDLPVLDHAVLGEVLDGQA